MMASAALSSRTPRPRDVAIPAANLGFSNDSGRETGQRARNVVRPVARDDDDLAHRASSAALTARRTSGVSPTNASSLEASTGRESCRPTSREHDDADTWHRALTRPGVAQQPGVQDGERQPNARQARCRNLGLELRDQLGHGQRLDILERRAAHQLRQHRGRRDTDRARVRREARLDDDIAVERELDPNAIAAQRIGSFLRDRRRRRARRGSVGA